MHHLRFLSTVSASLVFLLTIALFTAPSRVSAADAPKARYVILISVDGLSASYLTSDKADMPTLRQLARDGASAKGMITTFPSVTWPSHVSLITGATAAKHGVIGNAVFDRAKGDRLVYIGDPTLTKDQAIRTPTLYDAAHDAGLKTASIIWPCSNGAKTLDWIIPDSNRTELHERYTTPGFVKELGDAGIDISKLGTWGWGHQYSTPRDEVYSMVTRYLMAKHHPNLIMLHLITPDGVEHDHGPHTPEAYKAVAESDTRIREVVEAAQQPPYKGHTAIFVVSDHGFAPYDRVIQPNVTLKSLGLIAVDDKGKPTDRKAWTVSQGGSAFVYLLDKTDRAATLAKMKAALAKVEGVGGVLEADAFVKLGLPRPEDNPEMADLVLTTGPGFSFSDGLAGEAVVSAGGQRGTHGHLPDAPYMHATFVAIGAGIKPGAKLDIIRNIDVAPTIAHLLGIKLPAAEGRVLKEILAD